MSVNIEKGGQKWTLSQLYEKSSSNLSILLEQEREPSKIHFEGTKYFMV